MDLNFQIKTLIMVLIYSFFPSFLKNSYYFSKQLLRHPAYEPFLKIISHFAILLLHFINIILRFPHYFLLKLS